MVRVELLPDFLQEAGTKEIPHENQPFLGSQYPKRRLEISTLVQAKSSIAEGLTQGDPHFLAPPTYTEEHPRRLGTNTQEGSHGGIDSSFQPGREGLPLRLGCIKKYSYGPCRVSHRQCYCSFKGEFISYQTPSPAPAPSLEGSWPGV